MAPWLVVFDDHEVDNNWADETPENAASVPGFMNRRAAAFKAYYENMPLRQASIPSGPDMQVYRRLQWGRLANFHMLDTRQYRDDQAAAAVTASRTAPTHDDPARSLTGDGAGAVARRRVREQPRHLGRPRSAGVLRPPRRDRDARQHGLDGRPGTATRPHVLG